MKAPVLTLSLAVAGCTTTVAGLSPRRATGAASSPETKSEDRLRFAVIADTGRDGPVQRQLAIRLRETCDGKCDFTVFMGDNLYYAGIRPGYEEEDEKKLACLLSRYPKGPKFLVLGNHDYDPAYPDLGRAEAQLRFLGEDGDEFHGEHHFYSFDTPLASFFGLDTNYLVRRIRPDEEPKALRDFATGIVEADTPWVIAFGHHPLRSNGVHGNAGGYLEGDRYRLWRGGGYRSFMLENVVPHAHLYLSGHDHSLQFYDRVYGSGMAQLIAGSGSKCNARSSNPGNEAMMERYGNGYSIVEATSSELTVRFYRFDGEPFFAARRGRRSPWKPLKPWGRAVDLRNHCSEDALRLEAVDDAAGGTDCQ